MRGHIAIVVALLVAAVALLVSTGGSVAVQAVAFACFGVACVVAISLVFLAVGRSEDAEREAAKPRRAGEDPHAGEAARRARSRPPRRPR